MYGRPQPVDGGFLSLLRTLLGVGAGVHVGEVEQGGRAGPVQRLEGELGGEQVADGSQRRAGVGGQ